MRLARNDLEDFWSALNLEGDPLRVKAALLGFFPDLVTAYGDTAAVLGADFYDMLRNAPPSAASFAAVIANPGPVEQAEASARWALGPLFAAEPDPVSVLSNLGGALQRLVLQPGRDSIWSSGRRDSVRTAFARVPQGVTCRFCTMVASRGAVYATARTAGQSNRWHDDCDCVIVPVRSADDYPDGYDPRFYMDAYLKGEGIGRDISAA